VVRERLGFGGNVQSGAGEGGGGGRLRRQAITRRGGGCRKVEYFRAWRLSTRGNMGPIDSDDGRFFTRFPRARKEGTDFCELVQSHMDRAVYSA